MFFRGVGMSFAMVSMQAASFATIAPPNMGRASSLFSANRQVASALGVAAIATVLIERTASHVSDLGTAVTRTAVLDARMSGFHDAFIVLTIVGMVGLLSAFLIRDEDAAVTLRPRAVAPAGAPAVAEVRGR
jgi:hypothetical protein